MTATVEPVAALLLVLLVVPVEVPVEVTAELISVSSCGELSDLSASRSWT